MRPTERQLGGYETALVSDLQKTVRAMPLIQLIDRAPETRRKGQISNQCLAETHDTCNDDRCDCLCHDQWEGYSPTLPEDYQGIRNHPVGKTWHDHDDTSDRALTQSPTREWLQRFAALEVELSYLTLKAVELVGEPIETCTGCAKPIVDGEARHGHSRWHARCYQAHRRRRAVT